MTWVELDGACLRSGTAASICAMPYLNRANVYPNSVSRPVEFEADYEHATLEIPERLCGIEERFGS